MEFSKWPPEILHEIEHLVFLTIILSFLEKTIFPVRSVFVIILSLFTSVICYCQHGLRRKHGKCTIMQRMMKLLYEPKIESSCVVV
jgi:hypothetical protein